MLTGGAGHVSTTKEMTAKVNGKVAGARQPYVRVVVQIAVSLVGSNAVIRSCSGRSGFQCQRIDGVRYKCFLNTEVITVGFLKRYAYGIGAV